MEGKWFFICMAIMFVVFGVGMGFSEWKEVEMAKIEALKCECGEENE